MNRVFSKPVTMVNIAHFIPDLIPIIILAYVSTAIANQLPGQ